MQETIDQPLTVPVATDSLVASAEHASEWAGEPFLHPDEDPAQVLAPGTARRKALDDAVLEIEAGHKSPSSDWKIRYSLMLGLERVLSDRPPHLRSGTELRRHQVDALAGMLTELIAAVQAEEPLNGNGNGAAHLEEVEADEEDEEPDETSEEEAYIPPSAYQDLAWGAKRAMSRFCWTTCPRPI